QIDLTLVIKAPTQRLLKEAQKYAMRFQGLLEEIDGVEEVHPENYDKGDEKAFQYFTVKTTLPTNRLRKKLIFADLEGAGFTLEITGVTAKSLEVTLEIQG
ncbi:MAG: hypothetical protein ACYS47_10775, partial [Planctomycetota bacterium]